MDLRPIDVAPGNSSGRGGDILPIQFGAKLVHQGGRQFSHSLWKN